MQTKIFVLKNYIDYKYNKINILYNNKLFILTDGVYMNKEPIKILELFGGIGACTKALERCSIPHEIVDYVEIDKFAVNSYNSIHNTNFKPKNIIEWNKDVKVDLIMHGSPCQDFSVAGKQLGGDKDSGTRSSLMYETIRIVEKLKPRIVIWENVKNILSKKHKHNFNFYLKNMEKIGYKNYYEILNAKDYGIPQNRQRVFTISILGHHEPFIFPKKIPLKLKLIDFLEENVDEKFYLSQKNIETFKNYNERNIKNGNNFRITFTDINGIAKCITTRPDRSNSNYIITIGQVYGTDCEHNPQAGHIYSTNERFYKQELETFYENDCKIGDTINAFNKTLNKSGICQTLTTRPDGFKTSIFPVVNDKGYYRIRKLTPLECWRLMGFDDGDFYKAKLVNSNIQLYKQAGNSIVVNILCKIFYSLKNKNIL